MPVIERRFAVYAAGKPVGSVVVSVRPTESGPNVSKRALIVARQKYQEHAAVTVREAVSVDVVDVESRAWGGRHACTRYRMVCSCGRTMPWTTQERADHHKVLHQQAHDDAS